MSKNNLNLSSSQLKLTDYDIPVGISIIIATLGGVFYKMSLIRQIMNTRAVAGMST